MDINRLRSIKFDADFISSDGKTLSNVTVISKVNGGSEHRMEGFETTLN